MRPHDSNDVSIHSSIGTVAFNDMSFKGNIIQTRTVLKGKGHLDEMTYDECRMIQMQDM